MQLLYFYLSSIWTLWVQRWMLSLLFQLHLNHLSSTTSWPWMLLFHLHMDHWARRWMRLLSLYYDGKILSLVLLGLQLVSIYFGPESISGRKRDRNFGRSNSKDTIIIDESIIFHFIDKPITTIIQWLVYSSKAFINNYWVIIIVTAVFEFQVQPWMRLLSLYYHIHWQIDHFAYYLLYTVYSGTFYDDNVIIVPVVRRRIHWLYSLTDHLLIEWSLQLLLSIMNAIIIISLLNWQHQYQVISDRIFGPEFVSDQNLFQFISRLETSGDWDQNIYRTKDVTLPPCTSRVGTISSATAILLLSVLFWLQSLSYGHDYYLLFHVLRIDTFVRSIIIIISAPFGPF